MFKDSSLFSTQVREITLSGVKIKLYWSGNRIDANIFYLKTFIINLTCVTNPVATSFPLKKNTKQTNIAGTKVEKANDWRAQNTQWKSCTFMLTFRVTITCPIAPATFIARIVLLRRKKNSFRNRIHSVIFDVLTHLSFGQYSHFEIISLPRVFLSLRHTNAFDEIYVYQSNGVYLVVLIQS